MSIGYGKYLIDEGEAEHVALASARPIYSIK
jgi:hypothetical protein